MKFNNIFSKPNRILIRELVITDFKLRYQGSLLGYAWSLLKPLLLFLIMFTVFGLMIKIGSVEHYSVYLLLGIVLWTFFNESTSQGMNSIINRGDIIRKIKFPKYILVLSATISSLINLILNMTIVVILMIFNGIDINISSLTIAIFIIEIYILSLGLSLFLSSLNVRYRDTNHIWEILMQAGFYLTPVLYPLSLVLDQNQFFAKILLMNPVAQAIQDSRYYLITHDTKTINNVFDNHAYYLIPYIIVIIILITGIIYFKKKSKYFAEEI